MEQMTSSRPIVYQRLQKLGEGTFSTVYKALRRDRDFDIQQVVALKILKSKIAIENWRDEFTALERVNSSRCVRVIGWDVLDNDPTLILEWVDGVTLAHLSQQNRFTSAQIDEICLQTHEGLLSLEKAELTHGDLSLQNIMITVEGEVKLLDFGLSSAAIKMFTPEFAAPERLSGALSTLASDLFSLGRIREYLERREKIPLSFATKELTKTNPEERRFRLLFEPNPVERRLHRSTLAQLVRESKVRQESLPMTMIEKPTPQLWKNLLLLLLTTSALSSASATHDTREAFLAFRTKNWAEIKIDGRHLGYTPVQIRLKPHLSHKIEWRTADRRGERTLTLKPGQNMFIGDGFFK